MDVVRKKSSVKLLAFLAAILAMLPGLEALVSSASSCVTDICFSLAFRIVFYTVVISLSFDEVPVKVFAAI